MKKIKFVFLLLLLTLCFTVISCKDKGSNNEGNEQTEHTHNYVDGVCSCGDTIEVKYTVQFVDFDGTVLKNEEVVKGSSATAPSDPYRDGYSFAGWDKIYTNVTSDLVVNYCQCHRSPQRPSDAAQASAPRHARSRRSFRPYHRSRRRRAPRAPAAQFRPPRP